MTKKAKLDPMPVGEALRLLRARENITQTAASKREHAPDFRTLSHWETGRKQPSMRLLRGYLKSLGLDFHDLQDALDLVGVEKRLGDFDRRILRLEVDFLREAREP